MNLEDVLSELKVLSDPGIKNTLLNHGAIEPVWGVRIGDMKAIIKKIKHNQLLALQLFDSGISDAKYLAGLIADGNKMTKGEIQKWVENSGWSLISNCTVPWVASESIFGEEMALTWIDSESELIACSGWNTLSAWVTMKPDHELNLNVYKKLLERVNKTIAHEQNSVKYAMNGFVISLGTSVAELTIDAMAVAKANGKLTVFMGKTSCKVPYAPDYLQKIIDKGRIGIKRKTMKCLP